METTKTFKDLEIGETFKLPSFTGEMIHCRKVDHRHYETIPDHQTVPCEPNKIVWEEVT